MQQGGWIHANGRLRVHPTGRSDQCHTEDGSVPHTEDGSEGCQVHTVRLFLRQWEDPCHKVVKDLCHPEDGSVPKGGGILKEADYFLFALYIIYCNIYHANNSNTMNNIATLRIAKVSEK